MCALFSKKDPTAVGLQGDISTPAIKMVIEGNERDVSFAELTLSNNLSQQAIARLLIKKGVFSAEELLQAMQEIRQENYPNQGAAEDSPEEKAD
jgi:hypothetical protein